MLSLDEGPIYNLVKNNNCGISYSNDPIILVNAIIKYLDKQNLLQAHKKNSSIAFRSNLDGKIIYGNLIKSLEMIIKKSTNLN